MDLIRATWFLALGLVCSTPVHAEGPRGQARYVVETFQMPLAAGVDLVTQNLPGKEMHSRVLAAAKAGNASLTKLMVLQCRLGGQSTLKQTNGYPYPTEYDPPQLPQILALVDPGPAPSAAKPGQAAPPATAAEPFVRSPFNAGLGIISTTTPTAFEVIDLGDMLTLDGIYQDHLELDFELQSHELVSERMDGDIPIPFFATKKMEHQLRLAQGVPAFVGSRSTPQRKGVQETAEKTLLLTFITAKSAPLTPFVPPEQDPFRKVYSSVRTTLEVISVDKTTAHDLLVEQPADAALHARLTALVDQQQARRETVVVAPFKPGNRGVFENADEYVHPTEFDPPQLPMNMILANHQLLQDLRAGRQTGVGAQPAAAGGNPNGGFGLITTLSPTAVEITPLGERLELDMAQAGDEFETRVDVTFRRLSGSVIYNGLPHPVFEVQSLTTQVQLKQGEPMLLGTLNKPLNTGWKDANTEDRIWLAFLRVTAK